MTKLIMVSLMLLALCPQSVLSSTNDSLFNEICLLVDHNFYDSTFHGVDWPAIKQTYKNKLASATSRLSFAYLVNEMLSKLNASHTYYYTVDDPFYYQLSDIFKPVPVYKSSICKAFPDGVVKYTSIGIITQQIGDEFFVKAVFDSSPAFNAGIQRGDKVISVDDKPYQPVASFTSKAGSSVTIKIQRTIDKSSIKTIIIKPEECIPNEMFENAMRKSARIVQHNGIAVGYVHIWSFAGENYYEALKELVTTQFSNAKALVVDLRYGLGGANPDYLNIFNDRVPVLIQKLRNGQASSYDPQWRKPAVLLVNEDTRSGKELFTFGFKKFNYGKVVGTRTAGAVLGARPYFLSDGSMLYLAEHGCLADGENLEGKGVMPDIEVKEELKYCAGRDIQFDKAIEAAAKECRNTLN
jgi:carboxyl-terminal processing protease